MQDINNDLISAVREGRLESVRNLINSFGLSYSPAWSQGYVLLCYALRNGHAAVSKLLLTSGSKVNSKSLKPSDTPLHLAVINGDIEIVNMILDKGANIEAKNKNGRTPLYDAIENKKIDVSELLLKRRANVHAKDNEGTSLLLVAARIGCLQIVEHLLKYEADINCAYTSIWGKGYTPLHLAAENNSTEVVTLLLSRGANVDVKGVDGITPLHIAAKKGHTVVKLLLQHGAKVDNEYEGGKTALHIAVENGNIEIVKLLLQHGANVDNQFKDGKTILHMAVEKGNLTIVEDVLKYCPNINNESNRSSLEIAVHGYRGEYTKIVEALLEYGFIVNSKNADNPKLLHAAVEKGCLTIIEDLFKYGANVNMLCNTFQGFTPLHSAAKSKQVEVVELLIRYKADINAQDRTGKTPIFYAIENADSKVTKLFLTNRANIKDFPELLNTAVKNECKEIIEALLQLDADVNASDEYGRTALHFTAFSESFGYLTNDNVKGEIAKLLLNKGANADAQTKNGTTTLHLGAKEGYQKVIETLLKFGANINSRDNDGRTALHIASEAGHLKVVETLLDYGSDINITSRNYLYSAQGKYYSTALEKAMFRIKYFKITEYDCDFDRGVCPCEFTAEALRRHIVKMKTANLYVSEKNLQSVYNYGEFQKECEEEIARMKSEKIINARISFYDIVAKDLISLEMYMRNENTVQVLKSEDYKTAFPIYAGMIGSHFRKAMARKELVEQSSKSFYFLFTNFPELPYDCTEKIFSYLSNQDLRIFVNASKPLSIHNPNANDFNFNID